MDGTETSADFRQGRRKGDEEEPVIVAQRFLNIFRQLHIFNDERKAIFNKMLLELPPEILPFFNSLPGGTPLKEYLDELQGKPSAPKGKAAVAEKNNIIQSVINENTGSQNIGGMMSGDSFAKILASSLAQSNADIIKEFQNTKPYIPSATEVTAAPDQNMKLITDEVFSHIIANAISSAIENVEKKRNDDSNLIAKSFLELQQNLTKLVDQNNQLKIISNSDAPNDAAALFQVKNIVDDLLKSQSEFLKETTKNQKEELSSAISLAIKESQKLSTQSLIESFKHLESGAPAPITFASSSPTQSIEGVEQALKAQGKEFSSIISSALKESHKNSTQTIIETIETLRKDAGSKQSSDKQLNIEEIMRMQAQLFKEITQVQNREFSSLISSALKESQAQSTKAIVSALNKLQDATPDLQQRITTNRNFTPHIEYDYPVSPVIEEHKPAIVNPAPQTAVVQAPKSVVQDLEAMTDFSDEEETAFEPSKKKKKKKKKKNHENLPEEVAVNNEDDSVGNEDDYETSPKSFIDVHAAAEIAKISEIKDVEDTLDEWGWGNSKPNVEPVEEPLPTIEPAAEAENMFAELESNIQNQLTSQSEDESNEEEWEWSYEETNGEEGVDWEWDYADSEVAAGEEEGVEWEWEYEEVADDSECEALEELSLETTEEEPASTEEQDDNGYLWIEEEIKHPEPFIINIVGIEQNQFADPYL